MLHAEREPDDPFALGAARLVADNEAGMTPEEYLERVRGLLPTLAERARRTEELRRLPDETFADFQEQKLLRALQPKRYGGYELDPGVFYQAVTEIAAVCGSSGWIFGVLGAHNWHLAILPPQAQEDVWGKDDSAQLSTSIAPTGTVERVAGGFRLSGRWSFSSGCDFCQWVVLAASRRLWSPKRRPTPACFWCRAPTTASRTTGTLLGLCGTGSKDIFVDEALVPEHRTHSFVDAFFLRHPGTGGQRRPALPPAVRDRFPVRHYLARNRRRDRRARRISRAVATAHQPEHHARRSPRTRSSSTASP